MKYVIKVDIPAGGGVQSHYVIGIGADGRFICDAHQPFAIKWIAEERDRARLMLLCIGERSRLVRLRPRTAGTSSDTKGGGDAR